MVWDSVHTLPICRMPMHTPGVSRLGTPRLVERLPHYLKDPLLMRGGGVDLEDLRVVPGVTSATTEVISQESVPRSRITATSVTGLDIYRGTVGSREQNTNRRSSGRL